ncbi:MAG: hypothetical protein VYD19_03775 [Myxococcota bacterium]|nr:hypothetical protein [Myxococcota bacterium]
MNRETNERALHTLSQRIWSLETAYRAGQLAEQLRPLTKDLPAPIVTYYETRSAVTAFDPAQWSLREQLLRRSLASLTCGLPAQRSVEIKQHDDRFMISGIEEHSFSLSELARRRRWGLSYHGEGALELRVTLIMARLRIRRVLDDLKGIDRVLMHLKGPLSFTDTVTIGFSFEHLLRDLLSAEHTLRIAPIEEDLLGGWDLEVCPHRQQPPRRVQLSLTTSRERAIQKGNRRISRCADLSFSLFDLLGDLPPSHPFWRTRSAAQSSEGRVKQLRSELDRALLRPWRHPLGPTELLPLPLQRALQRSLIQRVLKSKRHRRQRSWKSNRRAESER